MIKVSSLTIRWDSPQQKGDDIKYLASGYRPSAGKVSATVSAIMDGIDSRAEFALTANDGEGEALLAWVLALVENRASGKATTL